MDIRAVLIQEIIQQDRALIVTQTQEAVAIPATSHHRVIVLKAEQAVAVQEVVVHQEVVQGERRHEEGIIKLHIKNYMDEENKGALACWAFYA